MSRIYYMTEAAEALGISQAAMRSRLHRGQGPRPMRLGSRLAWRPEDLEAYLRQEAERQGVAYSATQPPHQTQEPQRRRRGRPKKQQQ